MNYYLLWIDHQHSKIFKFTASGKSEQNVNNHHHESHTGNSDNAKKEHEHKFYHEVAEKLKDATELLIVGEGMGRTEFKSYLDKHHLPLAKKVIGNEPMDKATDGEILNMAKKYYHKYNLFN